MQGRIQDFAQGGGQILGRPCFLFLDIKPKIGHFEKAQGGGSPLTSPLFPLLVIYIQYISYK